MELAAAAAAFPKCIFLTFDTKSWEETALDYVKGAERNLVSSKLFLKDYTAGPKPYPE